MCSDNKKFLRLESVGIDSDCEFVVGSLNEIVKGHKLLFSVASDVFKAMFYGDLKQESPVKVVDLDPIGFKLMKQFIYTGEVCFTSAIDALLTFSAARKYLIPDLEENCIKYINGNIQPSEVLEFFESCKVLYISEFDGLYSKIIQEKTDEVVDSEFFLTSKTETIESLLKLPCLKLESEREVFEHFERWAKAESDRKSINVDLMPSYFNNLKKHIRFLTMSLKEFVSCVEKSFILTREEKNAILNNLIEFNSEPMPKCLSLEREQRKFKTSSVTPKDYQYKHKFIVSIDKLCSSCSTYTIPKFSNLPIRITFTKPIDGYICFHAEFLKNRIVDVIEIMNVESRLTVLAEEKRNNLVFENVFFTVLNWHNSDKHEMSFAKIPISRLRNEKFLRSTSDIVIIEASFNIKLETGEE
ncbi:BTB/POZ domain-containing protein 6 [Nilaparvata lugens]|uniref:BTB/POZ domain-containing protein 6 n=1 Tax=Nilaparvata lugens TaxID=108931 RepID=UPI00193E6211|nr:BTB/POZ domain-containing protein 6 [Nilaparvata lugens]